MRNLLILGIFLLFSASTASAQIERSIFEAFDLDEVKQIQINLTDSIRIEFWPGDNILVESNIAFYNGTKSIFERLIKNGRYALVESRAATSLTLSGNGKTTKKIANKDGLICDETIERTIYIPEDYALSGNKYIKVEEE